MYSKWLGKVTRTREIPIETHEIPTETRKIPENPCKIPLKCEKGPMGLHMKKLKQFYPRKRHFLLDFFHKNLALYRQTPPLTDPKVS